MWWKGGGVTSGVGPDRISSMLLRRLGKVGASVHFSRMNAILRIDSNMTHVCNLLRTRTGRLLRFRGNIVKIIVGLRRSGIKTILLKAASLVGRNVGIGHANHVTSVHIDRRVLNHIVSPLNMPLSKHNPVRKGLRRVPLRHGTPNIVFHRPISRPLRAKVGTVSTVVPVKHKRHRLVVNSHRANGATVTVSAVVGRHATCSTKGPMCYVCMTIKRGNSAMTGVIGALHRGKTVSCAIIITTATTSPTTLRCFTPFTKTTVNRCFHSANHRTLIICSSLSGRTITCHRISLVLHHPSKHRTCPNSVFCLRSHLLRHTTGVVGRRRITRRVGSLPRDLHKQIGYNNSLATLPVVRARTNSMSTCVPAGIVSVASKRVFLRASLFGRNFHPTVGINVSMSHMKNDTRVGDVGGITNALGVSRTRCHRLRTFSGFDDSVSTIATVTVSQKQGGGGLLVRPRCDPVPMNRRVTILCYKIRDLVHSVTVSRIPSFRRTFLRSLHTGRRTSIVSILTSNGVSGKIAAVVRRITTSAVGTFGGWHVVTSLGRIGKHVTAMGGAQGVASTVGVITSTGLRGTRKTVAGVLPCRHHLRKLLAGLLDNKSVLS